MPKGLSACGGGSSATSFRPHSHRTRSTSQTTEYTYQIYTQICFRVLCELGRKISKVGKIYLEKFKHVEPDVIVGQCLIQLLKVKGKSFNAVACVIDSFCAATLSADVTLFWGFPGSFSTLAQGSYAIFSETM